MDRAGLGRYSLPMKRLILLVVLSLFLVSNSADARLVDRTAALVNNEVILQSDIAQFQKEVAVRKELDPFIAFFAYTPTQRKEILEFLIQESLVIEKYKPSPEDMDQEISNIMRENNINMEVLRSVLASQNVTFKQYRNIVGISIAKRRMIDRDLRPLAIITEDEIKNFYYTQKEFQKSRGQSKLLISFDVTQIQAPNRKIADAAYKELNSGADFDSVIKKYEDQGLRTVELGVLREDQLAKPIRRSMEGLKVGESSKPISLGSAGLYVIHRIKSISAPHDPVYEGLKPRIRSVLFQRALKTQLALWTERVREEAYVHLPSYKN